MNDTNREEYICQIGEEESVTEAVLRAVASVSDRPVLELEPLHESIDTDSLDQLFASTTTTDSLQFRYEGYEVTVEPERVLIHEHK